MNLSTKQLIPSRYIVTYTKYVATRKPTFSADI